MSEFRRQDFGWKGGKGGGHIHHGAVRERVVAPKFSQLVNQVGQARLAKTRVLFEMKHKYNCICVFRLDVF